MMIPNDIEGKKRGYFGMMEYDSSIDTIIEI